MLPKQDASCVTYSGTHNYNNPANFCVCHRTPPIPEPVADDREKLQHPSRQPNRPHYGKLDVPQLPPLDLTNLDKQSARQACKEAEQVFDKKKYSAAAEVSLGRQSCNAATTSHVTPDFEHDTKLMALLATAEVHRSNHCVFNLGK